MPRWTLGLAAFVVGVLAAAAWGPLGEPHFDGTARSLILVDVIVLAAAGAFVAGMLLAARSWTVGRFGALMSVAALGFAAFYGTLFLAILSGGECGMYVTQASWQDRELFGAIDAPAEPAPGIPINGTDLSLGGFSVGTVGYWGGVMEARLPVGNETRVADDAARFLAAATDLSPDEIDERVEQFLRNRTFDSRRGGGALRLDVPIDELALLEWIGLPEPPATSAERDGVRADLRAAAKTITIGDHKLEVDAFGQARMEHDWGEMGEAEVLEDVQSVLARHGLPPPRHVHASGDIC